MDYRDKIIKKHLFNLQTLIIIIDPHVRQKIQKMSFNLMCTCICIRMTVILTYVGHFIFHRFANKIRYNIFKNEHIVINIMTKPNKHRCCKEIQEHPLVKTSHKKCGHIGSHIVSGSRLNSY